MEESRIRAIVREEFSALEAQLGARPASAWAKAELKGLPPAIYRQQALAVA